MDKTRRICKYCYQYHNLQYLDATNGAVHLVYRCPNKVKGKLTTVFLTFIPDLPLEHTVRKQDLKIFNQREMERLNLKLF